MSAIDQAFIRAYQVQAGGPASAPPRPSVAPPPAQRPSSTGDRQQHRPHFRPPAATAGRNAVRTAPPTPAQPLERRPLSQFTAPAEPVSKEFCPALEVDAFRFSPVVNHLSAQRSAWRQTLSVLDALADDGRTVVGVAGAASGAGCTTTAVCLARLVADAGKKVALVDGDFVTAGLARELGLAIELGWDDVLAGRVPLAEAAVLSLADRISLLPLASGGTPAAEKVDGVHGSVTAGVLRYHHDLVLIDLGSAVDSVQSGIARRVARQCRIDAMLLVDGGDAAADRLQLPPELADVMLGVVENRAGRRPAMSDS